MTEDLRGGRLRQPVVWRSALRSSTPARPLQEPPRASPVTGPQTRCYCPPTYAFSAIVLLLTFADRHGLLQPALEVDLCPRRRDAVLRRLTDALPDAAGLADGESADAIARILDQNERPCGQGRGLFGQHCPQSAIHGVGSFIREPEQDDAGAVSHAQGPGGRRNPGRTSGRCGPRSLRGRESPDPALGASAACARALRRVPRAPDPRRFAARCQRRPESASGLMPARSTARPWPMRPRRRALGGCPRVPGLAGLR